MAAAAFTTAGNTGTEALAGSSFAGIAAASNFGISAGNCCRRSWRIAASSMKNLTCAMMNAQRLRTKYRSFHLPARH